MNFDRNPTDPPPVNCKLCRFSQEIRDPMAIGKSVRQCRFGPPQGYPVMGPHGPQGVMSIWPVVQETDVCGQFQADFEGGPFSEAVPWLPGLGAIQDGIDGDKVGDVTSLGDMNLTRTK